MKLKQVRVSGYKNLIDCKVDLGDFNVIVGPNNSGKSNFLEVFQIFSLLCFGSESVRKMALDGYPTRSVGESMCKLLHYKNHPLSFVLAYGFEL